MTTLLTNTIGQQSGYYTWRKGKWENKQSSRESVNNLAQKYGCTLTVSVDEGKKQLPCTESAAHTYVFFTSLRFIFVWRHYFQTHDVLE